jgi:hypothetical protein
MKVKIKDSLGKDFQITCDESKTIKSIIDEYKTLSGNTNKTVKNFTASYNGDTFNYDDDDCKTTTLKNLEFEDGEQIVIAFAYDGGKNIFN